MKGSFVLSGKVSEIFPRIEHVSIFPANFSSNYLDEPRFIVDDLNFLMLIFFLFVHIYPTFTRKRIVSLYFEWDVRTRFGVAIFEVSGPPVFHVKAEASR